MTDIDKLKEEYKNVRAVFGAFKCRLDEAIQKAEYIANAEKIAYQKGYESGKDEAESQLRDENGEWAKNLKKKAYQSGLTEGVIQREKMVKEAYEKGTKEGNVEGALAAWDIATIIVTPVEDGGTIPTKDLRELFDVECDYEVFKRYTPSEALAKLQEYDKQIRVGDEVIANGNVKFVVTNIDKNEKAAPYHGIDASGVVYCYSDLDRLEKTGRHVDLSKMFSSIREESEKNE